MIEAPKSLARPDEVIRFPGITEALVEIAGMTIARTVQEPGWRWSTDVRPLVGGEWCEARHIGVMLSGRLGFLLRDGRSLEFGPDDVFDVPPGHDGYTVGDEPAVMIEWSGMRAFAGAHGAFDDRVLATLLFTDLVDSTRQLVEGGDIPWADLISLHHQTMRSETERFRGRIVDTAGDGLLAVFDAPARALRCASAIRSAAAVQGLRIRAGIHAGEVATAGDGVRGVAVHEAARIMAAAAPDEILVSEAVPALVSGVDLHFEGRGEYELKGLGTRTLFAYTD
ncbi:MAG TPA: adenylate/guanylate cyclase domain-containing protein [Gaiellaceae bacterium]|jgi:class 3 adenylate cyclase|nr:adenylate/guanylate cyclase domain-containing protein [Gaiellaceae bacterium]